MTREEARKAAEVMMAYADGKDIEFNDNITTGCPWKEIDDPMFDWLSFIYRVKVEPKYRPFKTHEECRSEMLNHSPFGWLYDRYSGDYVNVSSIQYAAIELMPQVNEETIKDRILYNEAFKRFTFLDGSTFGIKQ